MDEGTKKELKDLENMVINWTKSYVRQIDPHGGNEYLIDDFNEEFNTNMVPYIVKLGEAGHLTSEEFAKFQAVIGAHITGFINLIYELEESEE